MGTAAVHEGVRRMRFESLVGRQEGGELTQIEAAEMLGVSVRTFQRWAGRSLRCTRLGWCGARRSGRRTARSVRGGRCGGCFCTRTGRGTRGWRGRLRSI